jgi:sorbitol-specific phosphotransferase system component IIC
MATHSVNWYLQKVNRISGYVLFPVILIFMLTGFGMTGRFGFDRVLSAQAAQRVHQALLWPVIGLFFIHSIASWYFSFRRWGWIK